VQARGTKRMRQVSLVGVATLSMSAVNRVLSSKPNAVVGVDVDGLASAPQRYESLRRSCFGRSEPVARVHAPSCVECTWCKRLTCAYKWTWSCGPDEYSHTPGHHYHSSIVVAVEKGTWRRWLSWNETLEVCWARRTWCEAHAGTVRRVRDVVKPCGSAGLSNHRWRKAVRIA
jgi:hypothetical protein